MPNYPAPVLEIVNGSTVINLLARGKGWHLLGFPPRAADLKNGGTWQSSPLSTGRQLVSYRYDNIIDTWSVAADGYDEDGIIELAQELERAGVAALDYWTADWADTPVYIRARGPKETNTRYAIIHQIRVPEYADQYRQPMFGVDDPVMDRISISIEHGQWQSVAPGSQECVEISSVLDWSFDRWYENTTTPTGNVLCMFRTTTGRLLAGTDDTARIYYSDDDGGSWALLTTLGADPADRVEDLEDSTANNYLWAAVSGSAGGQGVHRSLDNGASWSRITITASGSTVTNAYRLASATNESIVSVVADYTGGLGSAGRFQGATGWVRSNVLLSFSGGYAICQLPSGWVVLASGTSLSRAFSGTLETVLASVGPFTAITRLSSGRILAGNSTGDIYYSDDANGASGTWSLLWSGSASTIHAIMQSADGDVYVGDDGTIWKSEDNGVTWSTETVLPSGDVYDLIESGSTIFASDDSSIVALVSDPVKTGSAASCSNQVYVANKLQRMNLTHIKVYDASGTSYSDIFPSNSYPVSLLPDVPSAGDIVYFGADTGIADVETGPFSSLVFDLVEPFVGWTGVAWEYWDGSAWSALTAADKTLSLVQVSVNSVAWVPPSDWATTTVDGIAGYWVRFRVATVGASPTPPEQQSRNVYAVVNPYVEIAAAQIGGDIPALARVRVENVSDNGGPGGSAPNLYANRVLMGLRSVARGELFTAYLNASDEQNPVGVTVTAGTDTSFINAIGAPSGRLAQWSPTGTGSWVTILTFSLATTIATQYYGTFRAFLRARQSGGTAGQMQLRLNTSTGSGGVSITTDAQVFANTNDHQIIDFGQLTIPLSSYLKQSELGDVLTIAVQGNTSSTTPDCNMYDLVLLPVDEWAADLTDGENSVDSELGSGNYLDVDSVSFPKRQLRNAVKATSTGYTKAIWQQVANGPAILQANERQRLWFLTMRTASAGSSDWRSEPEAVHRVQMWSAERYRWARGGR